MFERWSKLNTKKSHLNDQDEREILVEGCKNCRHTRWVIIGIAAMVYTVQVEYMYERDVFSGSSDLSVTTTGRAPDQS